MSLSTLLVKVGDLLSSRMGKTVMSSLGVGLVTTTITVTLLNIYINYALSAYDALGDVIGIFGLAGFNVGLGIIFGALSIKMYLRSAGIKLRKV